MKSTRTAIAGLSGLACALFLSACNVGSTYGTGVSQGQQTLNDLYGMMSFRKKSSNIDYSDRPDLIVPEDKASLPAPVDTNVATSNPDWPETPEQRIARIRGNAEAPDERTGAISTRELLRETEGATIEARNSQLDEMPNARSRAGGLDVRPAQSDAERAEIRRAKAETKYSTGASRKYLTEPPVVYRVPAASAPQGQESFTEEELLRRKKLEEKRKAEMEGRGKYPSR
ncbi:MAG: hypothetical protein KDJ90_20065 [Nitratireductor sp.]|nr:hypothetical protein [Nitratireductor sp.]